MDVGQGHSGSGRHVGNSSSSSSGGGGLDTETVTCVFCGVILDFDLQATQLRDHLVEKHDIRMLFGLNLAAEQILLAQRKFSSCPPSQKQMVSHPSSEEVDKYIVSQRLPDKEKPGSLCLLCDKVYTTIAVGRRHFKEQHEKSSNGPIRGGHYKCNYCKSSFRNARYLNNHMHREHKLPYPSTKKK